MGAAALKIDDALDRASRAASRLSAERAAVRDYAVAALRALERRLVDALAGEPLRGLTNVAGDRGRFVAARVGGRPPRLIDDLLPYSGDECLVLGRDGHLYVARVTGDGHFARRASDADLLPRGARPDALVLPAYAAATDALSRHVALSERRASDLAHCSSLLDRLRRIVEG
jgi:hypothetical protein